MEGRVCEEQIPEQREASQGNMGGCSKLHQVKTNSVVSNGIASEQFMDIYLSDAAFQWLQRGGPQREAGFNDDWIDGKLKNAKIALEFYEKSQDAEFEIVEVLYSKRGKLYLPESDRSEVWRHVSFVAKAKNADCGDVSPKHLFAELKEDKRSKEVTATYCSAFEPSDDPGFNHGCIFCRPGEKFHPADGYRAGSPSPPWVVLGPTVFF